MLEAGVIILVEEFDWISLMVVQQKKMGNLMIYVDLHGLNIACVHDPFSTPSTDGVLESVGGRDAYSFKNGFLGYHQVRIMK
jgi:hypothetical protein